MTDKIQVRLIFIIMLLGKIALGNMLLRNFQLETIYVVEFTFLVFSAFLTAWIIFAKDYKFAIAFYIIFDCCNSVYMYYNHFVTPDVYFYFHTLIGFLYLIINKMFVGYRWLNVIINIYIAACLIRNYFYFPIFGNENYLLTIMIIVIINLLVWELKNGTETNN